MTQPAGMGHVVIGPLDTTFTASCELCGTTFAGRLDDDLVDGVFLCRAGHPIVVERRAAADEAAESAAASAA